MAKIEEHPLQVEVEQAWRQPGNPDRHDAGWIPYCVCCGHG